MDVANQGQGDAQDEVLESQADAGDTGTQETQTDDQPKIDPAIQAIYSQIEELNRKVNPVVSAPVAAPKVLSPDEIKELLKTDAYAGLQALVQQSVTGAVKQVDTRFQQNNFDQKTEKEFPSIVKDKAFQGEVREKVQEFLSSGEYTKDSPQLVYRAAQWVSLQRAAKGQTNAAHQAGSAQRAANTGEAPRNSAGRGPVIADNDPRIQFAKMIGVKDMDGFKKELAAKRTQQRG